MARSPFDALVWSNALYAFVAEEYARRGYAPQGAALLACAGASCAYHRSRESDCVEVDEVAAVAALALTLCAVPALRPARRALALGALAVALCCKYALQPADTRDPAYWWPHLAWHLAIAGGQAAVAYGLPPRGREKVRCCA